MNCLRRCRTCGIEANTNNDLELFVKGDRSKHGRDNLCKECARVKDKLYIKNNTNDSIIKNRIRSRRHNRSIVPNICGHIYILSNPLFPGWLKIGKTSKANVWDRVRTYNTYCPENYVLEYSTQINDVRLEGDIIDEIALDGGLFKKEWVYLPLDTVKWYIDNIQDIVYNRDMTVDKYETLTTERQEELKAKRAEARVVINELEG